MPTTNGHGPSEATEQIALYLPVSSEEQREREIIVLQREFLEQYCELYGLDVADIYEDDGVSGTIPLHERSGGRRLLEGAKESKFEAVLVSKLDRLGRTLLVIVDTHDRLQEAGGGVALISGREPIDTSNPSGRLIFQMLASFAEYERETIGERTRAGQRRAYSRGSSSAHIAAGTYVGNATSHSKGGKRYYQYRCGTRGRVHDPRYRGYSCPQITAEWLESFVWQDVRGFLENPGEVLERVRGQLEGGERVEALEQRLASLRKRLAAKRSERERAIRLYTRGLASKEEAEVLLADLKNQADNLRLLISATEAELSTVEENRLVARNTKAWLLTLRKNLDEVEQDSDEAFRKRRELVKLLIEKLAPVAAKTDASEWISATGSRRPSPHPQQEVWMVYGTALGLATRPSPPG